MPYKRKCKKWLLVGCLLVSMVGTAQSEDSKELPTEDLQKLAQDVQNPVSDLMRFGLVNTNWFGSGPNNFNFNVFDLQGIWSRRLKKLGPWAIVNRLNIPLIYLPSSAPPAPSGDSGSTFGLGDIQYTALIARDESKRFLKSIGGIGPTFLFNSSTDDRIGTGKWAIGPTLAVVNRPGRWVLAALVSNLWSFAGDDQRQDVNLFILRPFINYNVWKGWYLTTTPLITANWELPERNIWSVPIGGGIGKVALRAKKQPLNFRLQGFYYVEKSGFAPDWSLNFEFQILFPTYDVEPSSRADTPD